MSDSIKRLFINEWKNPKAVIPVLLGESACVRTSETRRVTSATRRGENPSLKPPERFRASRNDIFETSKLCFGVVYFKEICVQDSAISNR